ncbi:hypothetical protein TWF696_007337 [Orbilia brochopaga]|uniref:Aminoacyl-transfer RNA synthetases class-II family profile domain-containing protein n=1 Tax=Orbilia brochopaga TaxID=3140254 RepID=A0AAV9UU77_9PEZI
MTAPFRICVRCQLDAIAAAPAAVSRSSVANLRRQSAVVSSQWRSRRAYSDAVASQESNSTPAPAPAAEPIEHQKGEPDNHSDPVNSSDSPKSNGPPRSKLMEQRRGARTLKVFRNGQPAPDLSLSNTTRPGPTVDLSFTPTLSPGEKPPWSSPGEPHNCKPFRDINADDLNQPFYIRGWLIQLNALSDHLIFGKVLQDGKVIQIIHTGDPDFKDPDFLRKTRLHTPVQIYGWLRWKSRLRPGQTFENVPFLDKIELVIKDVVHIGNPPIAPVIKDAVFSPEKRYLQLRTDRSLGQALRLRHKVSRVCRQHLEDEGFLEVETPLLFKSTPEGAREFLVPTRKPGHVYALPQSPQQYKQILMAGGVHKYFQFARCFRDEDLRADRQPEFTQLDLEMAFASGTDVQRTIERLLKRLWWEVFGIKLDTFPSLPYHSAISQYGSDKPDLRFEPQILKLGEIIDPCLNFKPAEHSLWSYQIMVIRDVEISYSKFSRMRAEMTYPLDDTISPMGGSNPDVTICYLKDLARLTNIEASFLKLAPYLEKDMKGLHAAIEAMKRRHLLDKNNIVVIGRRKREFNPGGSTPIGIVRKMLASKLVQYGVIPPLSGYKLVWVNRFPLFTRIDKDDKEPGQSGGAGYKSTHHPFTAPLLSDRDKLFIRPWETIGQHYDIVLNGVEIGGGSTRIHEAGLQRDILEDILKVPPEKLENFKHLFEMLDSGCPPHAGLALGFDRLVALMHGTDSIRNVIAFPKNSKGVDPVVDSPALANSDILKEYGLARLEESPVEKESVIEGGAKVEPLVVEEATESEYIKQTAQEISAKSKLSGELADLRTRMEELRDIASSKFAEQKKVLETRSEDQGVPEPAKPEQIQPEKEVEAEVPQVKTEERLEVESRDEAEVPENSALVAEAEEQETAALVVEAVSNPEQSSDAEQSNDREQSDDTKRSNDPEQSNDAKQSNDPEPADSGELVDHAQETTVPEPKSVSAGVSGHDKIEKQEEKRTDGAERDLREEPANVDTDEAESQDNKGEQHQSKTATGQEELARLGRRTIV